VIIANGDFKLDARGIPVTANALERVAGQVVFALTVPKGRFGPDPDLGSELHTLKGYPGGNLNEKAFPLVEQALMPLAGVTVKKINCTAPQIGTLSLEVKCAYQGENLDLEVVL